MCKDDGISPITKVVGLIINMALLRGLHVRRIEYFLPWLVKMAIGAMILPPALLWIYFLYKDSSVDGERIAAIVGLVVGFPFCEIHIPLPSSVVATLLMLLYVRLLNAVAVNLAHGSTSVL